MKKRINLDIELDLNQLMVACNDSFLNNLNCVDPSMIMKYFIDNDCSSLQIFKALYDYTYTDINIPSANGKNINLGNQKYRLIKKITKCSKIKHTNFRGMYDIAQFLYDLYSFDLYDIFKSHRYASFIKNKDIKEFVRTHIIKNDELELYSEDLLGIELLFDIDELPLNKTNYFTSYIVKPVIYNVIELMKNSYLTELESKYMDVKLDYFLKGIVNPNLKYIHFETYKHIYNNKDIIISYIENTDNLNIDDSARESFNEFKNYWMNFENKNKTDLKLIL